MYSSSTMGNCRSKTEDTIDSTKPHGSPNGDRKDNNNSSSEHEDNVKVTKSNHNLENSPNGKKGPSMSPSHSNENVIKSTKAEVNSLLEEINGFQGTTEKDKNYMYLDEMLTRCMLKLDRIECNNNKDRGDRKEAIRGVNQAISILEKKLELNSDMRKLGTDLLTNE